jgi:hypothetical protein
MRIKILVHISKTEIGSLVDFRAGEIIAIDETVGEKLIKQGKAEYQF